MSCEFQLPPNLRSRRTPNVTRQYKERECRISFSPYTPPLILSLSPPPSPYCAFLFVLGFRFFSILRLCARTFLFPPELPLANGWRQIPKSDCPLSFFFYFVLFSICFSVCLYRRQLFNSRASEFFYSGERFVLARNKLTSHRFMVRTARKINRRS